MEEIIKCNECGEIFENKKIKANHVRWKHRDQSIWKEKMSDIISESYNKKHGKVLKEIIECSNVNCNNNIELEYRPDKINKKKDNYFCSKSCSNFSRGKRSDVTKQKIANTLKKDLKTYECKQCSIEFKHNRIKICCSIECQKEFRRKNRTELQNYRADASFNFNIFDYPEEFDLELIKKYGMYSASNRGGNLTGISRDHMYSCKMGLINNINPRILSHPANCKLMIHSDNISKNSNSSITIEELMVRIRAWNKKYLTQI